MSWEHNEGRAPSMKDVERILADLSKGDNTNPPVLGINLRTMMRAKQNGFPLEMHHATLEPVLAMTEKQQEKLREMGYVTNYIPRHYPKAIYRRNIDPKFAIKRDLATGEPQNTEFVESRVVRDEKQHEALKKQPVPRGCGPWVEGITNVEELADEGQQIERIEREIAAARKGARKKAAA